MNSERLELMEEALMPRRAAPCPVPRSPGPMRCARKPCRGRQASEGVVRRPGRLSAVA